MRHVNQVRDLRDPRQRRNPGRALRAVLGLAGGAYLAASAVACVGHDHDAQASSDAGTAALPPAINAAPSVSPAVAAPALVPPAPNDAPELCASICARSAGLHCPQEATCVRRCDVMRSMTTCRDEVRGALDCFAATPPDGWTCNDHGLPSVKVGLCDGPQSAAARCLAAHPPVAPR